MPVLLSEKDLARLYNQAVNMDALLPLIEASMADFNSAKVAGQARVETSLREVNPTFSTRSEITIFSGSEGEKAS